MTTHKHAHKHPTPVERSGPPLIEMKDISIAFGGIKAVDHATVDLYPGEVVGLLGHNGAGKSTLIKILSGAYKRDHGDIFINGEKVEISNPRDAKALGIETIYQTLALADNVDAAANLYLGRELRTSWGTLDDGSGMPQGDGPPQPEFPPLQGAGEGPVGRPAPVGRHRPRHPLQRPHPDHGRAHSGARPPGNGAGGRTHQAAQGGRHRHLPHQPRHP
jgi:ABC-type sugar transport system ATPase subunit